MRREDGQSTPHNLQPERHAAAEGPLRLAVLAALLCVAVAAVHAIDQHGFPGNKTSGYVQGLYYALEAGGVLTAAVLLAPRVRIRWLLALSVAVGPIIGYVLSRGPGLPNYTDDVGNWGEPLGVISLVVESALLATTVTALGLARRRVRSYGHVTQT